MLKPVYDIEMLKLMIAPHMPISDSQRLIKLGDISIDYSILDSKKMIKLSHMVVDDYLYVSELEKAIRYNYIEAVSIIY